MKNKKGNHRQSPRNRFVRAGRVSRQHRMLELRAFETGPRFDVEIVCVKSGIKQGRT